MPSCSARASCRAARKARREFVQSDCYQNAIAEVDKLLENKSEREQLKLLHKMADHTDSSIDYRKENAEGRVDHNIFFRSWRTPDLESTADAIAVHRSEVIESKARACRAH